MSPSRRTMPCVRRAVRIASVLSIAILICSSTPVVADTRDGTRCRGIRITPGDNIQGLIDRHRRRATFCFARGVYRLSETIWTGNKFPRLDLRAGAVIDGGNGDFVGITGVGAPDRMQGTVIVGGIFENFGNVNSLQRISPVNMQENWVIKGSELRQNFNAGLSISGDGAHASRIYVHHNGRYGITVTHSCDGCAGPRGVTIEHSEIAFNNTRKLDPAWDAGGTKFSAGTDRMIVRHNDVHDNYGSGLWFDGYNTNANVYGNAVYDNYRWGIFWELSYGGARIHDNVLTGNGIGDGSLTGHNAQLVVANSDGTVGGIEIYDNVIRGSASAVSIIDSSTRSIRTRQVHVHHNDVTMRASTGVVGFYGADLMTGTGNRFDDNMYRVVDRGGTYWTSGGQTLTWPEWTAIGQDNDGSLRLID
jgi:Right handed beta helix region